MSKQITVDSDDPENPHVALKISGDVELVVTVAPSAVKLYGAPGKEISGEVTITAAEKYPFSITGHKLTKGTDISVELKTDDAKPQQWHLLVMNTRESLGRYYDVVTLETDSKIKPQIQVRVFGNISNPGETPLNPGASQKGSAKAVTSGVEQ